MKNCAHEKGVHKRGTSSPLYNSTVTGQGSLAEQNVLF